MKRITTIYHVDALRGFRTLVVLERHWERCWALGAGNPLGGAWEPVSFELDREVGADEDPVPDLAVSSELGLVLRGHAADVLGDLLKVDGELLPIVCVNDRSEYYVYNVTRVLDAVDLDRSGINWYEDGRVDSIWRYWFRARAVPAFVRAFTTPQGVRRLCVTQEFVDRVRGAGLRGLGFMRLWSSDDRLPPALYRPPEGRARQNPLTLYRLGADDEHFRRLEAADDDPRVVAFEILRPKPRQPLGYAWVPFAARLSGDASGAVADFPYFSPLVPASRASAVGPLRDLLDKHVELLPVACENDEVRDYYLWNVTTVLDALDTERSDMDRYPGGNIGTVRRHVFRPERVPDVVHILGMPQVRGSICVTQEFVDRVRGAGLKGFVFERLFSSEEPLPGRAPAAPAYLPPVPVEPIPINDGLEIGFRKGARCQGMEFYTVEAGRLVLRSGRILAVDAYYAHSRYYRKRPLALEVTPGRYRVVLSIARMPSPSGVQGEFVERVALVKVVLVRRRAVRWDHDGKRSRRCGGYAVASAHGCFVDGHAMREIDSRAKLERLTRELDDGFERTYQHTRGWANVVVDPATGANMIAFTSGYGDGRYCSYIGYDRQGEPCAIVTDLGVVDFEEPEGGPVGGRIRKKKTGRKSRGRT